MRVLTSIEPVTGYREVRYPKMDAAQAAVEAELKQATVTSDDRRDVLQGFRTPTHV